MWTDELKTNVLGVLILSYYRLPKSSSVVYLDVYSTKKQSLWYTTYLVRFTVYVYRRWVAYYKALVVHS